MSTRRLAPVIAVVNMKGGVGKTTISANVFRELFRNYSKSTLLVDFDPQYNLSQLLLTRDEYEQLRDRRRTLWYVLSPEETLSIFNISESDFLRPGPVGSYVHGLRYLRNNQQIRLELLPGDFRTAAINLMTEPSALRFRRQRFLSFISDARTAYDLVVLDCNPSSSFMTRAAVEAATHLLIPVRADRYSILGLEMLTEYAAALPGLERAPDQLIVVNDLPSDGGQGGVIGQLRSHPDYGPRTLAAVVRHSRILEANAEYSGFAVDRRRPHSNVVTQRLRAVAQEIALKVGLTT